MHRNQKKDDNNSHKAMKDAFERHRALGLAIDKGLHEAIENAIKRHKMLGQSIAIWQNGKVIVLPASEVKLSLDEKE